MIQYAFDEEEYIEAVRLAGKYDIIVHTSESIEPRWKTHLKFLYIKETVKRVA